MDVRSSAKGKVALITGAASGIGRHLTGALAARGYAVLATDANPVGLEAAHDSERWGAHSVALEPLDVRSADAWEAAFDTAEGRFGHVDVLLNVAGVLRPSWITEIEADDVSLMLDVNAKGVALGTRAAAKRMVRRREGHIVNIGSLASLAPVPGLSLYSMSKFAVRGFSLAAAVELREHGVAVTVVMPDAVQTPMLDLQADREEAALTFSGPRALSVEEIGRVVIDRVLPERPMEIGVPASRSALARFAGAFPRAAAAARPLLVQVGKMQQARARKRG